MANKQKSKQQPAAACSIQWRYLYRSNPRGMERSQAGICSRFSHLSQPDDCQAVCRGRKKTSYCGILYRCSLGVTMNGIKSIFIKLKWKLKLLWQATFGKPKYINFTDNGLCFYTRCFLAQKAKRNRV